MSVEAFYIPIGEAFEPSEAAVSPWDPKLQSGVALIGLLTHAVERTPAAADMMLARLTMDILRPAPMAATSATCRITRDGRNMQNLEAVLEVDGKAVARATALRVRLATSPAHQPDTVYPPPEAAPDVPLNRRHGKGSESRVIYGGLKELGPGAAWSRPIIDLVRGEPVTPLEAATMAADFGGALSCIHDGREWSFANVDLAIHFVRPPVSDWIRIEAMTMSDGDGSALAETRLADLQGEFARAHQTLFITPNLAFAKVRESNA
jgi:acyl-coenzyme A thioesterase PaaI-like protein